MQPTIGDYDGVSREDHFVRLSGVTWQDYERLLEIRGERATPRYTYLEGELEIMSPSRTHEWINSIARFIDSPTASHAIREYRKALAG